jgi:hypothetical protein
MRPLAGESSDSSGEREEPSTPTPMHRHQLHGKELTSSHWASSYKPDQPSPFTHSGHFSKAYVEGTKKQQQQQQQQHAHTRKGQSSQGGQFDRDNLEAGSDLIDDKTSKSSQGAPERLPDGRTPGGALENSHSSPV